MRYLAIATVMTNALIGSGPSALMPWTRFPRAPSAMRRRRSSGLTRRSSSQLGLSQERVEKANDALEAQASHHQQHRSWTSRASTLQKRRPVVNTLGDAARDGLHDRIGKIQQLSLDRITFDDQRQAQYIRRMHECINSHMPRSCRTAVTDAKERERQVLDRSIELLLAGARQGKVQPGIRLRHCFTPGVSG